MREIALIRQPGAAAAACRHAEATARRAGWSETDVSRVVLAVGEAVANAIDHGRPDAPVRLRLALDAGELSVTVLDGGPGPSPTRLATSALPRDPLSTGGRGLFIQSQLADRVRTASEGGVVLSFRERW